MVKQHRKDLRAAWGARGGSLDVRRLGLAGGLLALAACTLVSNVDRTLIPEDQPPTFPEVDGGVRARQPDGDAGTGDAGTGDASTGDASTGDASTGDASTGDADPGDGSEDAAPADAGSGDAPEADGGMDSGLADAQAD